MKKILMTVLLGIISLFSFSQDDEIKTLFKKNDTSTKDSAIYGGYGAPFVGATTLNSDLAILVGGKGGLIKNHHFAFGGIGGAAIGTTDYNVNITQYNSSNGVVLKNSIGNDSTIAGTKSISYGCGGVFFEYIFNYSSPVHISIPVNFQVGGVKAGNKDDDLKIKSSSMFIIEPGLNFEFNFTNYFVPSLTIGYRYVTGSYSSQLSGIYGALLFKFGKF